ncbi:Acyl-CoA hydrolase [Marinobacter sp. es.048]|uniref:acetyl-CoA hydrolase/transferase family protein n=1 Tax=Marinobacter sp. es.048 TaxID=1761795 RepID=UPI000B588300|nr:acetyl-CoA hydrolase/transferase C-terminal domain-containing protein [Marinobacter sp. es.048]SNC62691.1 Acyl-CoA hydrolase [Marinobacter sp. es.048]
MPTSEALNDFVKRLKPGMTVYVPGVSGESLAFYRALKATPDACMGVRFVGALFPGINRSDYLGLHPESRQRNYFMLPGLRAGLEDGRAELLPLDYPGIFRDLQQNTEIDVAVAQVTPPDASGHCSLGLSQDFIPAVWDKAKIKVLHINPSLPRTQGSFRIRFHDADVCCDETSDVVHYSNPVPGTLQHDIAEHVVNLVNDGDTLELGIGKLPSAVLEGLTSHRDLKIYSGMVLPNVSSLIDSGSIKGRGAVRTGAALGDTQFYERLDKDPTFYFQPVSESHSVRRISEIPGFCAINSAIEVDLFGQINSDSVKGRQLAGVGGLPSFVAGARLSERGRSIIVLPSMTDNQKFSRIVPALSSMCCTAVPRHDADYVITEQGVANLRGLSIHERAQALISIAAPSIRDELFEEWRSIIKRL